MLGLGSSLFTESVVGGDIKAILANVAISHSDDENVRILLTVTNVNTQNALLSGITSSSGAKVNGTCTVELANVTEYGSSASDIGVDTFNIFQLLEANSTFYFLSLAASDITINSVDDYEQVDLTAITWLDPSGADAELGVTGSAAIFIFHNMELNLGSGFLKSDTIDASPLPIDNAD